eukprot:tig00020912_g15840.t1
MREPASAAAGRRPETEPADPDAGPYDEPGGAAEGPPVDAHESIFCVTGEPGVGKLCGRRRCPSKHAPPRPLLGRRIAAGGAARQNTPRPVPSWAAGSPQTQTPLPTALLAKVVLERLCGWSRRHVYYFAGSTPGPASAATLLRHLTADLLELLPKDQAARRRAIVVVLDALERVPPEGDGAPLAWLPSRIPAGVKFVVSCLEGSAPVAALRRRFGVQPVRLGRLSEGEARVLLGHHLEQRGGRL